MAQSDGIAEACDAGGRRGVAACQTEESSQCNFQPTFGIQPDFVFSVCCMLYCVAFVAFLTVFVMQELAASCGVDASVINNTPVKRWEVWTPFIIKYSCVKIQSDSVQQIISTLTEYCTTRRTINISRDNSIFSCAT